MKNLPAYTSIMDGNRSLSALKIILLMSNVMSWKQNRQINLSIFYQISSVKDRCFALRYFGFVICLFNAFARTLLIVLSTVEYVSIIHVSCVSRIMPVNVSNESGANINVFCTESVR